MDYPPLPDGTSPRERVARPAFLLIAMSAALFLFALLGLSVYGLGLGSFVASATDGDFNPVQLVSGTVGTAQFVVGLVGSAVSFYGGLQMKKLTNYRLALAASILVCVPFCSPCCVFGWPAGVFAFITLRDDDVKAAFD